MAHTHDLEVVGQRIKSLVDANKMALNIHDIWYGDQERVPRSRTVCIEPINVTRIISGSPDMVTNTFSVALMVYILRVGELQAVRQECNALASSLENLLHTRLGLENAANDPGSDIVVHGYVEENLSGYTYKAQRLVRSSRLSWTGISKTSLRFGP